MSIVILGADGYLGWPLTCALAERLDEPIFAVDDLSKRRRVAEAGFASGVPIASFGERLARLREVTGRRDIVGIEAGVEECVEELVREHRPSTVAHLAQIPSAPFSMRSFASARETLVNNEAGNLAVLFALRDHSPETHLVKMGSMGEYAHCGVPLGEGYVHAVLDGEPADRPVPFPREAGDVYHVTKINDTNFISMACREWGLSATDVMQSIVYGLSSPSSRAHPELATRFDCDPVFGSVLNRFVAQAVRGVPLTVHGSGSSTTGLIALRDVLAALSHWILHPAGPGEHRVINQATETRISVLEIARLVQRLAGERGMEVEIDHSHDPRHEQGRESRSGPARNLRLRESGIPTVPLQQGVRELLDDALRHADYLSAAAAPPDVDWKKGQAADAPRPAPLTPSASPAKGGKRRPRAPRASRATPEPLPAA